LKKCVYPNKTVHDRALQEGTKLLYAEAHVKSGLKYSVVVLQAAIGSMICLQNRNSKGRYTYGYAWSHSPLFVHGLVKEARIRVLIQVLDGYELEVSALSTLHYDLIHIADKGKCPGSRTVGSSAECHKANFSSNIAYFQCSSLTISDKHNLHCRFVLAR